MVSFGNPDYDQSRAAVCPVHVCVAERLGARQEKKKMRNWSKRAASEMPAAELQGQSESSQMSDGCLWPPFLMSALKWSEADPTGTGPSGPQLESLTAHKHTHEDKYIQNI